MVQDYYQTARENERVFRNILRDLRDNREKRPMGTFVPRDLKTELPLEEMFREHSEGNRYGRFTITEFTRQQARATIGFQDIACLSGGGAELAYLVKDDSVQFEGTISTMMS